MVTGICLTATDRYKAFLNRSRAHFFTVMDELGNNFVGSLE